MAVRIVAPTDEALAEAAETLRTGGLVAFPTETVYGLGANALDPEAVARIFAAKGRPSTNPVIVHLADHTQAALYTSHWPERAATLASTHWPGPLTLVLEKAETIPEIVTAGGPTVGLRVPNHPVALALLRTCRLPIAAPSANRSEEVSPTTAQHVADSLGPWVEDLLILDGGACTVGIESTVLDLTQDPPHVLRPGHLTVEQLGAVAHAESGVGPARAPGQMLRHYAPKKTVVLVPMGFALSSGDALLRPAESSPDDFAQRLYAQLRALDADPDTQRIVIELPPDAPEWAAIHDRLRRAASR